MFNINYLTKEKVGMSMLSESLCIQSVSDLHVHHIDQCPT